MRFAIFIVIYMLPAVTDVAHAASVQRINEEQDKLIVDLSAAELEVLEEDQRVYIESGEPRFLTTGVLKKLNLQKKTVLIVLDAADTRFRKKQWLTFMPYLQNSIYSERISTIGHYHQYNRSLAGARAGYDYVTYKEEQDSGDRVATTETVFSGYRVGADGYLLFDSEWFGAAFGYERRSLEFTSSYETDDETVSSSGDSSFTYEVDHIRPSAWLEVEQSWRIGLNLDYYMINFFADQAEFSLSHALLAPKISAVRYTRRSEFTFFYQDRAKSEAVTVVAAAPGFTAEIKDTIKLPAEAGLTWRSIASPDFAWSSGLVWVFYERELTDSQPIRPKSGPEEMMRLNFGFEHRLESGSKFDWSINYAGAQSPTPAVAVAQQTNQLQLNFGYHRPVGEGLLIGGNLGLSGGLRSDEDEPETEGAEPLKTTVNSIGASLAFFIQKDFDLAETGRRRR